MTSGYRQSQSNRSFMQYVKVVINENTEVKWNIFNRIFLHITVDGSNLSRRLDKICEGE